MRSAPCSRPPPAPARRTGSTAPPRMPPSALVGSTWCPRWLPCPRNWRTRRSGWSTRLTCGLATDIRESSRSTPPSTYRAFLCPHTEERDMYAGFENIAERAAHYCDVLMLDDDMPAAELLTYKQEGKVVLIARYLPQLRRLVARAVRANAAEREDLESAAVLGFLEAVDRGVVGRDADPYTYAYTSVVNALQEANRLASPKPVKQSASDRFWRAMGRFDNDPHLAREWSAKQRLTGHELLDLADGGDEMAREIVDARIARCEARGNDVDVMLAEGGRGLRP